MLSNDEYETLMNSIYNIDPYDKQIYDYLTKSVPQADTRDPGKCSVILIFYLQRNQKEVP